MLLYSCKEDIQKMNKYYRTFIIDDENYQNTRKERIAYLEKIGYEKEIIEKELPKKYIEII